MTYLQDKMNDKHLSTGGYVLFILYTQQQTQYLLVVMLNDAEGSSIDPRTLEVNDITHLDLKRLNFAGRIDIDSWQKDEGETEKYLSFIKGRGAENVSEYFWKFLGCDDISKPKEQTKDLVKALLSFCTVNDFDKNKSDTYNQKAFDYCDEKRKEGKPVYLESLSAHLDEENTDAFLKHANGKEIKLDGVIEIHREAMRRLTFINLSKDDLKISFSKTRLGKSVILDGEKLVISDLPVSFKDQLKS